MKKSIAIILSIIFVLAIMLPASAISTVAVKSIKLSSSTITLDAGKTATLTVTFTPANTTQKLLTYGTSNKNVATVDKTGKITAVGAGTATITVSTSNKKVSAKCTVTVKAVEVPYTGQLPLSPQKVTLKYTTHSGWNASYPPPSNDLPIYKEYERITNVHIEWDVVPVSQYNEIMAARMASGSDLPDMLDLSFNISPLKLAKDGIIIAQNDLFDKYAYWTKQYIKELPSYKAMLTYPDGKIYGIEGSTLATHLPFSLMINKLAVQRVGMNMPTTADELYNVLKAFKTKDINGNGKPDEAPLVTCNAGGLFPQSNLYVLGNAFGLELTWYCPFMIKNGQMVCQWQLPEFRNYLAYLNKLYREGLLNQDVFTADYDKMMAYISKGQCGAVLFWGTFSGDPFTLASPEGKDDPNITKPVYVIAPPLKAPDGRQYFTKRVVAGADGMGITTACAENKRAVAIKWADFIFTSPKALEMYNYGVEGLTYKKNADGTIVKIAPAGTKIEEWNTTVTKMGGFQQPRAVRQQFAGWLTWMTPWQVEMDKTLDKYYVEPSVVDIKWSTEESEKTTQINADLNTYYNEMFVKFVTGQESLLKFEQFKQQLNKLRVNELKALYEQRYKRQQAVLGK